MRPDRGKSMGFWGEEVLFFNNVADLRVGALIITFSRGNIEPLVH